MRPLIERIYAPLVGIDRVSVNHRLYILVICQTVLALLLVLTAWRAISAAAEDYRNLYEFRFQAIYAVRQAMEVAAALPAGTRSDALHEFYGRYRTDWEISSGSTAEAIHFRRDLADAGETNLPRQEDEFLSDFRKSLSSLDIPKVREDLAGLYDVNLRYAVFANRRSAARMRTSRIQLAALGIICVGLTLFFGLHVRRAIGPRIQRMVENVRRFENGTYEKVEDAGGDDIAVLANALAAGLSAIAQRDRDRERFLAVAAHELKTPVTSIHGYASLLANHPKEEPYLSRGIEIIGRQSWRLNRLIEALFLVMRARSHDLRFEPASLNISDLLRRVLHEMEPFLSSNTPSAQIEAKIYILGDEALLEHALWSLITCTLSLSGKTPIHICLRSAQAYARLIVAVSEMDVPITEVQQLFLPFRTVEYETGTGVRSAVGLYLCREIVRVHNGTLSVQRLREGGGEFVVELPA